jgi:hypothetical protein
MVASNHKFELIEVTDPAEIEKAKAQRVQFDRNSAWLQSHVVQVYTDANRGKFVAIAGETPFFADTAEEAYRLAEQAFPDDRGVFVRHIPKEKRTMIYAL